MNIYICNVPVSFPRSEYGGMITVVAKDKTQLKRLLTQNFRDFHEAFDLNLALPSTISLVLDPDMDYPAGIVREFIT